MNKIIIKVNGQSITAKTMQPLVAKSVGITRFTAEFDKSWDGFVKTIVFTASNYENWYAKAVLYEGGEAEVPWEVLQWPGELTIAATGSAGGKFQPTAMMQERLRIWASGAMEDGEPREPSLALWQQALAEIIQVREKTENADNAAASAERAAAAAQAAAADIGAQADAAADSARQAAASEAAAKAARQAAESAKTAAENAANVSQVGTVTIALPVSGWSGSAPYTQTVAAGGVEESWVPGNPVLVPGGDMASDLAAQEAMGCISKITSGAGALTVTCYEEKPQTDVTIRVPGLLCRA